jgi:hypothetical protein
MKVRKAASQTAALAAALFGFVLGVASHAAANPIQTENALPGTSAWRLTNPALSHEIEGYASLTSVNAGGQVAFFVSTSDPTFQLEIYRMGWYGGAGGRQLMNAVQWPGIQQIIPVNDQFGMLECHWTNPFTFDVPSSWTSGFYLVKLTGSSGKQSYIIFVVRNDSYRSNILFVSGVNTWQAYNDWGGISHYQFNSQPPYVGYAANKVSFNRPYAKPFNPNATLGVGAGEFLNNFQQETAPAGFEYNMVRFLEREGYDVTYSTDVDVMENGALLLQHQALVIAGHNEYWSDEMRTNVINARDQGVNLAVFGADTAEKHISYETSPITAAPDRTINFIATTYPQWRQIRLPESAWIGVMYLRDPVNIPLTVMNTSHWVFNGTGLHDGDQLPGLVGYEADTIFGPGTGEYSYSSPANIITLGDSVNLSNFDHYNMAIYTAPSGAMVFATGSMQFNWGLDDDYNSPPVRPSVLSPAAQQIARNVLNRFIQGQGISVAVNPAAAILIASQMQQFTATVAGTGNQQVNWSVTPFGVGSVTTAGLYTAPAVVAAQQAVTVQAASVADPTKSGTATVTLNPISVAVSPPATALYASQVQQFTATVSGTSNQQVTWGITPAGVGSITATGLYTAPASVSTQQAVTVQATSIADPTKSGSATVTLTPPPTVSVSPPSATLYASQMQAFTATVGTSDHQVTWSVAPAGVGSISTTGVYTAPALIPTQQTVTVKATSVAFPSQAGTATVTLNPGQPPSGYAYRRVITIAHSQVPNTDQPNFPLALAGTYPYLATAANGGHVQNASGYDIIFAADAAGSTVLNWDVETYNAATGAVAFWIQVPTVSHTADTVIYMLYGNAHIATFQGNRNGTWNSGYAAVYHLADNAANPNVADATVNANIGTAEVNTSTLSTTGEIGPGVRLNGSTDYVNGGQGNSLAILGNITLEAWVNISAMPSLGTWAYVLGKGYNGENESYFLRLETDNGGTSYVEAGTEHFPSMYQARAPVSSFSGNWHHLVGTFDDNWHVYVDGVQTTSTDAQPPLHTSERFLIGARDANGGTVNEFNGVIDEVRVSNVARASDWIATEYNNQSSPSTFYTIGPEQGQP